jgi:hypothetical protein
LSVKPPVKPALKTPPSSLASMSKRRMSRTSPRQEIGILANLLLASPELLRRGPRMVPAKEPELQSEHQYRAKPNSCLCQRRSNEANMMVSFPFNYYESYEWPSKFLHLLKLYKMSYKIWSQIKSHQPSGGWGGAAAPLPPWVPW